jgi:hypothetical protein
MKSCNLTAEEVCKVLDYNPETVEFVWKQIALRAQAGVADLSRGMAARSD